MRKPLMSPGAFVMIRYHEEKKSSFDWIESFKEVIIYVTLRLKTFGVNCLR
jgi:hypothetical protein